MTAARPLVRNIGISAHIDSGKTTLTERILFYAGRIRAMHEVRGKDGVGATMDSMDLERERGITIQSAATYAQWRDHHVNVIDTPGHVDFTIEVERALRVLDGAVLVLCGVAGVQSQSLTVDRQMRRHGVPCLAFVNKLDRRGADPVRVQRQMVEKLGHNAVLLQLPLGLEEDHRGVIDLVTMEAVRFEGDAGERVVTGPIPGDLRDAAEEGRERLIDAASMFSDELTEAALEEQVTVDLLRRAIREATINRRIVPVLMGSAYKNKGVQSLLDAIAWYLPAPHEVGNTALDLDREEAPVELVTDTEAPFVGLAFKLEDGRYGQLTYVRVYQGTVRRGDTLLNTRDGSRIKVGRLGRMHADQMEGIDQARAGDIVALFGVDCRSGDTFTDGSTRLAMTSMHVPEPVVAYGIQAPDNRSAQNLSKALSRFTKEDPTFRVTQDPETGETVIHGMGELQLDVYVERIRREYDVPVLTSPPRVAYRESITRRVDFDYLHKKQTGGSGQYGRVIGWIEPLAGGGYEFVDQVRGGNIPRDLIPSCDKGFQSMLEKGGLIEAPVTGVRVVLDDGNHHPVDSSELAFREASRAAWRQAYPQAGPVILEPVMRVEVDCPAEFMGPVVSTLVGRRGLVVGTAEEADGGRVEADVPLAEMFGYATSLRSATRGRATFTMEFARYEKVPASLAEALIEDYRAAGSGRTGGR